MGSAILALASALPEHLLDGPAATGMMATIWPRLRAARRGGHEMGRRFTVEPAQVALEGRSLTTSMEGYERHALDLAGRAAGGALARAGLAGADVDLVISTSCTGYMVPSLEARLAGRLGLREDVLRLPITELGCSAGSAALAFAHRHLAGWPKDRVLVVAVELPSMNFQPADVSIDNLAASLVFGDGAAAAVMASGEGPRLTVHAAASHLVPGTTGALGYDLRDGGFHVVLDRALPGLVEASLGAVADGFRRRCGVDRFDFVVAHGGGPRILDAVESALGLDPAALAVSREVYGRVGNVSSASVLFALELLEERLPPEAGDGLCLAFGPGLTIELAHLRSRAG